MRGAAHNNVSGIVGRARAAVRAGSALLCRAHGEPALRGRARRPASCAHAGHWHRKPTRTAALSHRHPCCVDTCVRSAAAMPPYGVRTASCAPYAPAAQGGLHRGAPLRHQLPCRRTPYCGTRGGRMGRRPPAVPKLVVPMGRDALLWCPHLPPVRRGERRIHHLSPASTPVSMPRRVSTTGDQRVAAVPLASGTQLSCTAVPAPHLKPGTVAISTDAAACVDTHTYLRRRAA